MKNLKKLICVSLAFVMTVFQLGINTYAFSTAAEELNEVNDIPSFTDNFNSYSADITNKGNSIDLGGGWVSKTAKEGTMGQNNELDFGFNAGGLYISTATQTHESNISGMMGTHAGVSHDIAPEITENQVISFTATKTHGSDAWGIKFLRHNDNKDYYAVILGGMYAKSYAGGFLNLGVYRFNDGVATPLYEITRDSGAYIDAGALADFSVGYNDGVISWDVKQGSLNYKGSVKDTSLFDLEGKDLSIELFTTGSDSPDRHVIFDDFKVSKNVPYLTSPEPDKVLYADVYTNASVIDEVIDFYDEYSIRKIISEISANTSFDLYLSNDKESWSVVRGLKFNSNGVWGNTIVNSAFRYAALSIAIPEDLKILSDAQSDKVYTSLLGKQLDLYAKFGDVTDNAQIGWELNQDSATIENGVITPSRRGALTATASYGDDSLDINIDIQGELDMAIRNNTVESYITNNKPVVDEINRGIKADDNAIIEAVLRNAGDYKISDIVDIESSKITALGDEMTSYINRIQTYGEFDFSDVDDVHNFFDTFEKEYYVGLACNVADTLALEDIFAERNDYLGLALENQFYLKYKEEVLSLLTDKEFVNLNDLQKKFESAYILEALGKALSVEMVEAIVSNSLAEIGYNEESFDENKGIDMYGAILAEKDKITTIELFKKFVDEYEKPEEEDEEEDDKPARRPSTSGDRSFKVDASTVEKINTETMPEKVETPVANKIAFSDVSENHWAYSSILNLCNKNIISGNPDGSFAPERAVTRAEFIKMLLGAIDVKTAENSQKTEFADVTEGDWYYTYFDKAYILGLVTGDSMGNMRPMDMISREEMAVLIYRALTLNNEEVKNDTILAFNDKDEISLWATDAVNYLTAQGILKGSDKNTFNPKSNTTRAESAAVIERIIK